MVTYATDNPFPSVLFEETEAVDLANNPASGQRRLIVDPSDHLLYLVDTAGTATLVGTGFANPMTTSGDIIYGGASGVATRLAKSTDGKVLTLASGLPSWATAASGSVATDAIFDAKGDLAAGTGADTAAKLTVGANDTILMADSGQSTGLKWVASQTPSTQAFSDAAAEGTADTYARGDHKHAMPANPGGGGALVLRQHTASTSATLDFTSFISSTYDEYLFEFVDVLAATNAVDFLMRISISGSFSSSANYHYGGYTFGTGGSTTFGTATGTSFGCSNAFDLNNTAGAGLVGDLRLIDPASSKQYKKVHYSVGFSVGSVTPKASVVTGYYDSTSAIDGMRFLYSTGNIASGTIRVYGVAK